MVRRLFWPFRSASVPCVPHGAGVRAGPVAERHRARVCADEGDNVLPAEWPPGPRGPLPRRRARGRARLRLPRQAPHPLLRHLQEGQTPPRDRGPPLRALHGQQGHRQGHEVCLQARLQADAPGASRQKNRHLLQWRPICGPPDHHHRRPGVQRPGHHPGGDRLQSGARRAAIVCGKKATCLISLLCLSARVWGHLQESMELSVCY